MIDPLKTYIAISAHHEDCEIWLGNLIPSLIDDNGIDPKNIYVIIGGCKKGFRFCVNGINYHGVLHNSYDYTALIEIINYESQPDHWVLLHETTKVAPHFWNTIIKETKPYNDFTSASKHGWTNIGVFSRSFLMEQKNFIRSFRNCDKFRAILGERLLLHMGEKTGFYFTGIPDGVGIFNATPLMPQRRVYFYKELGLYKYQQYTADSPEFLSLLKEQNLFPKNKKITL